MARESRHEEGQTKTLRQETYTIQEVADHLSVSSRSVLDWIREGRLRAMRLSPRTIRVPEDDLDDFLERARQAAQR